MKLDREEKKFKDIKRASIFGIIGNIFLLIIKAIVGFITNSQAMIADSVNSAGDILSSVMTYVGNRIASIPSDDDHNLGHGKAEYIYSMLISVAMLATALIILKDSIMVIVNNDKYNFSIWLVIVCLITIITKIGLFIYTYKLSKKYNNLLIKANSKDHIADCFVTGANLISCLMTLIGVYIFDGIVGIAISLWMLFTYTKIFIESYHVLMDKAMDEETKNQVYEIVKEHKEIIKTNHFNSTPVGYKYQISLTIFVDGNLSTFESHEIANKLEKEIIKRVDSIYLAVIHVNPMDVKKTKK
ncbi:MAG: cation transporter [Bacilli bacterium]|nr:cation transporter [Bacilli bacterium]